VADQQEPLPKWSFPLPATPRRPDCPNEWPGAQVTVNSPEPDVDAIRPSNLSPVAGWVRGIILDIDKKSEIDATCSAA